MAIGTLVLPPSPSHFRRAVSEIASSTAPSRTPSRAPSPSRPQVDHDLHMGRRPTTPDSSDDDEPRKKPMVTLHYATENQSRKRGKAAVELCSYAIVWWTLFYLAGTLSGSGAQGVSRRLVSTTLPFSLSLKSNWKNRRSVSLINFFLIISRCEMIRRIRCMCYGWRHLTQRSW
jgi:phosphatidylinositol glycan class W